MWQPEDRDPCTDNWFCLVCRRWSEGYRKLSHAGTRFDGKTGRLVWACSGKPVEDLVLGGTAVASGPPLVAWRRPSDIR